MSMSSDSCDLAIRLESSKLLPLFEEMQAIGFPIPFLEENVPKLKKGAPSISFTIYTYVYKVFRELFNSKGNYLDRYIVDEKVIDREGFAKSFFKGLKTIIQHDQALPTYQYICPGHPLAKCEEIAKITRLLRKVNSDLPVEPTSTVSACHRSSRAAERLAVTKVREAFSLKKGPYGSGSEKSVCQAIQPGNIVPRDIPWKAVRETVGVSSDVSVSDSEEDPSPDEGIRSWNNSSVNRGSNLLKSSTSTRGRSPFGASTAGNRSLSVDRHSAMGTHDMDPGIRSILEKFEHTESLQNLKFRSIEDRLIRMEHGLVDNNAKFDQHVAQRLDNHEIRIEHLEGKSSQHSEERAKRSSAAEQTSRHVQESDVMLSSNKVEGNRGDSRNDLRRTSHHRASSKGSSGTDRNTELERLASRVPSRAMSISKPLKQQDVRDSGISSTQALSTEQRQEHRTGESRGERTASVSHSSHITRSNTAEMRSASAAATAPISSYFARTQPVREPPMSTEHKQSRSSSRSSSHQELSKKLSDNHARSAVERHFRESSTRIFSNQPDIPDPEKMGSVDDPPAARHSRISQREASSDSSASDPLKGEVSVRDHQKYPGVLQEKNTGDVGGRQSRRESHDAGYRRRNEMPSYAQYREKRHKSVGTNIFGNRMTATKREEGDGNALLDLNERVQLRLRERIRTAEDTLNACIETIRRDYVLLKRH